RVRAAARRAPASGRSCPRPSGRGRRRGPPRARRGGGARTGRRRRSTSACGPATTGALPGEAARFTRRRNGGTDNAMPRAPRATKDHPPSTVHRARRKAPAVPAAPAGRLLPRDRNEVDIVLGERRVHLTNLQKPFWPELGITKGDLIQYYVD